MIAIFKGRIPSLSVSTVAPGRGILSRRNIRTILEPSDTFAGRIPSPKPWPSSEFAVNIYRYFSIKRLQILETLNSLSEKYCILKMLQNIEIQQLHFGEELICR